MDGDGGTAGDVTSTSPAGDDTFVSLYRRFRPGRFGELRGQPHVVRALQGAVREGRVAHAYLFSGPRGTGKTSTARILARALNCADPQDGEPCGACASCLDIARGTSLDVHELDAASNNGVDAMRDLIAHAALGTPGRWKVYIVDEVHMLSTAAANALLKTLEEPPGHVVFVLATTDPQKVPPTIRSRTQHFEFGLLPADTLAELVRDVNAAARLELDERALSVVVRRGRGSARDTLSALDQVAAAGGAEGIRPEVSALTDALVEEDAPGALAAVARLHEAGWGPQQLATELVDELRQAFLVSFAPDLLGAVGADATRLAEQARQIGLPRLVRAIEVLGKSQVDMREAPDPRVVLEVALVRLARPELDDSPAGLADRLARLERAVAALGAPGAPGGVGEPSRVGASSSPSGSSAAADPTVADAGPASGARPSLGTLRRQRAGAGRPAPATPEPEPVTAPPPTTPPPTASPPTASPPTASPPTASPPTAPAGPPPDGPASPSGREPVTAAPPPPAPPPPAPSSAAQPSAARPSPAAPSAAPATGTLPDRDQLVEAWGDHILRGLPARVKAFFSAGRFTAVEGHTATFALPNAAHRDRCQEMQGVVEEAISAHFRVSVALELVVDDGPGTPGAAPSAALSHVPPAADPGGAPDQDMGIDPDDDFDPTAADAGSTLSVAHAKVLEAFPGAEEVTG